MFVFFVVAFSFGGDIIPTVGMSVRPLVSLSVNSVYIAVTFCDVKTVYKCIGEFLRMFVCKFVCKLFCSRLFESVY